MARSRRPPDNPQSRSFKPKKRGNKKGTILTRKTAGLAVKAKPWQRIDEVRHGLRIAEGAHPDLTGVKPKHPDEVVARAVANMFERQRDINVPGKSRGKGPRQLEAAAAKAAAKAAKAKKGPGGRKGFQPGNVMGKPAALPAHSMEKDLDDGAGWGDGTVETDEIADNSDDSNYEMPLPPGLKGHATTNLKGMQRSKYLWQDLGPAKAWMLERLRTDLQIDGSSSIVLEAIADAFAEVHLMRRTLTLKMIETGGPFTASGATRAIMHTMIACMDRELRIANALGFEKKQKQVNPIEGLQQAVAKATAERGKNDPVTISGKAKIKQTTTEEDDDG